MPHTGNLPAWGTVDVSKAAAVTGTMGVGNGGTGLATCASGAVLFGNGGSAAMSCATISGTNLTSNIDLPGKAVKENTLNVIVSNTNATNSLSVVRGGSSTIPTAGNCGTAIGEGYSCSRSGTGIYVITFTTTFGDTPVCTVSPALGTGVATLGGTATPPTTTTLTINVFTTANTATDAPFDFICMGQRP